MKGVMFKSETKGCLLEPVSYIRDVGKFKVTIDHLIHLACIKPTAGASSAHLYQCQGNNFSGKLNLQNHDRWFLIQST